MLNAWRRPDSGVWYYRRVVPLRLRSVVGKTEIRISLGTKDHREARKLLPSVVAGVDAALAKAAGTEAVAPVLRTLSDLVLRMDSGTPREAPPNDTPLTPPPERIQTKPSVKIASVINGWVLERKPPDRTVYEWRRVFDRLIDHLGHDSAERITKMDIVGWKDSLLKAGRTTKCVSNYLTSVRAILGWGQSNGYLDTNPAAGVIVKASKGAEAAAKSRLPYGDDDVRLILREARKLSGFKRWVPFLLAYSGARLNEICQLHVHDVRETPEGWVPQFVDYLAKIHTFDFTKADLTAFDVPASGTQCAEWGINFWSRVFEEDCDEDVPLFRIAAGWLKRTMPKLEKPGIVHGDYRVGNFLFTEHDSRISAWLDWELGRIGDYHQDLAWVASSAYYQYDRDGTLLLNGLMTQPAFLEAYEQASGNRVNGKTFHWYKVYNCFLVTALTLGTGFRIAKNGKTHQDVLVTWLSGVGYLLMDEMRALIEGAP